MAGESARGLIAAFRMVAPILPVTSPFLFGGSRREYVDRSEIESRLVSTATVHGGPDGPIRQGLAAPPEDGRDLSDAQGSKEIADSVACDGVRRNHRHVSSDNDRWDEPRQDPSQIGVADQSRRGNALFDCSAQDERRIGSAERARCAGNETARASCGRILR